MDSYFRLTLFPRVLFELSLFLGTSVGVFFLAMSIEYRQPLRTICKADDVHGGSNKEQVVYEALRTRTMFVVEVHLQRRRIQTNY
jgi:hypothetical protein